MTNNRSTLVSIFTIFVMLTISIYTVQPVQALEGDQISELSNGTENVICDQPPSDNLYGGIGRSEYNPPNGTTINQSLTNESGRTTATGVCGTYRYISGWWFNTTEMTKLPYDTIMYGTSPYAIISGDGNNGNDGNDGEGPIVPIPEMLNSTSITFGILAIFGLFVLVRRSNK